MSESTPNSQQSEKPSLETANAPILLESSEYVWIFTKKIDVLMEEYKTLRQELIGTQASSTNIFYYGLFTLGAIFAIVQGMAGQINSLFKPDIQTLELDTSRFYALTHSLFIILAFVIPAISFIFITKWMSNARSIAIQGSYLVEIESELNRAFTRIEMSETTMNQLTKLSSGFGSTELSTERKRRPYSEGRLFNDYELNIGWETSLRKARESTGQPQLMFGGYHIIIIMLFFGLIAFGSQISVLFLFGLNWFLVIPFLIFFVELSFVVFQVLDIRNFLKALRFEDVIEYKKHKGYFICTFALFLFLVLVLGISALVYKQIGQNTSIFSEDKMMAAKQEIIDGRQARDNILNIL